jgi:glycosyltransferase involved in cell wall biosynthesis
VSDPTRTGLRVLWLSPWLRPLARVQVEALRRRGADVLLVTCDLHPESDTARDYELVRDPRWIALAGRAPRVQLVHDDRPHDAIEELPVYERAVFDRWGARSAATVAYSDYVAAAIAGRRDVRGTRIHVLPLPSDLDPALVPPLVGPEHRRDFIMIGRLHPYKNIDLVLEAWRQHLAGGGWRGDELVLIGDGSFNVGALPEHARRRGGSYRYSEIVETLAAAKGSISHYRRASQSGVQVLSMQLGVTPIVSTAGALPEYQPPGCAPVGVDDVAGLVAAFDELADPAVAAQRGAAAAQHYAQRFSVDCLADRLLGVLTEAVGSRR